MERKELFDKLHDLAQMDFDAVRVYDEALEHVTDAEVRRQFEIFRGEHKVHATQLGELIAQAGGQVPQLRVDVMGHFADWATAIRGMRGTEGALHAMRTAEKYHNRRYATAAEWDVGDATIAETLGRYREDERRHLEFVESRLGAGVTR